MRIGKPERRSFCYLHWSFQTKQQRSSSRSKMHMQTQSVGGNDNFWQTLDSYVCSNNNPFDCCGPIEKSLSKGHYCLVKILESLCLQGHFFPHHADLNIQNQIYFLIMALEVLSTCCSVQSSDLDNRLGQIQ